MQSNCFVLFSNFENLPLVMIEAMCCGLTVITTDVGGCKCIGCHLPLAHLAVLHFVDPFSVSLLLLEPGGVLRLFDDDLDPGT